MYEVKISGNKTTYLVLMDLLQYSPKSLDNFDSFFEYVDLAPIWYHLHVMLFHPEDSVFEVWAYLDHYCHFLVLKPYMVSSDASLN